VDDLEDYFSKHDSTILLNQVFFMLKQTDIPVDQKTTKDFFRPTGCFIIEVIKEINVTISSSQLVSFEKSIYKLRISILKRKKEEKFYYFSYASIDFLIIKSNHNYLK